MATNKELVEQAVGAIPKWMAFLDSKQAEQNLILEQMQDDETQFAPKTFTERLTSRFTNKQDKPEPIAPVNNQEDNRVKLEKETPIKPQDSEEVDEETEVAEEDQAHETVSSEDYDKQEISNEDFKDIF